MLDVFFTGQFKKDYRKAKKVYDIHLLDDVIDMLRRGNPLPPQYRDHPLASSRNYKGQRECHIKPDWLLIYRIDGNKLVLTLTRTGSHSELFN